MPGKCLPGSRAQRLGCAASDAPPRTNQPIGEKNLSTPTPGPGKNGHHPITHSIPIVVRGELQREAEGRCGPGPCQVRAPCWVRKPGGSLKPSSDSTVRDTEMRRLEAEDCTPVMNYVNDSAC